jgi:hypothetical protein
MKLRLNLTKQLALHVATGKLLHIVLNPCDHAKNVLLPLGTQDSMTVGATTNEKN